MGVARISIRKGQIAQKFIPNFTYERSLYTGTVYFLNETLNYEGHPPYFFRAKWSLKHVLLQCEDLVTSPFKGLTSSRLIFFWRFDWLQSHCHGQQIFSSNLDTGDHSEFLVGHDRCIKKSFHTVYKPPEFSDPRTAQLQKGISRSPRLLIIATAVPPKLLLVPGLRSFLAGEVLDVQIMCGFTLYSCVWWESYWAAVVVIDVEEMDVDNAWRYEMVCSCGPTGVTRWVRPLAVDEVNCQWKRPRHVGWYNMWISVGYNAWNFSNNCFKKTLNVIYRIYLFIFKNLLENSS